MSDGVSNCEVNYSPLKRGSFLLRRGHYFCRSPQASIRVVPTLLKVRILIAALGSRSCTALHSGHCHRLSLSARDGLIYPQI